MEFVWPISLLIFTLVFNDRPGTNSLVSSLRPTDLLSLKPLLMEDHLSFPTLVFTSSISTCFNEKIEWKQDAVAGSWRIKDR